MKRLVLIGGGHSHLAVLDRFGTRPVAGVEIVLVNPGRFAPYSGMIPGLIAGDYTWRQCHIDLALLADFARARLIEDRVVGMDAGIRQVALAGGGALEYDLASVDIGSEPAADGAEGVARHAIRVKPIDRFLDAITKLRDRAREGAAKRIAVVGAGAAGVEVLLSLQHRLCEADRNTLQFVLVTDAPFVLPSHGRRARAIVERILRARRVEVVAGRLVATVNRAGLVLADGLQVPADAVVWATGASAASWLAATGLALDARGFIAVDRTMRSASHPQVFAAGDCATTIDDPRPKSGVFAVRQGPVLAANLQRSLLGQEMLTFSSSSRSLALFNCGDRHAVAAWGCLALQGRWIWHWKDHIDRRFMGRYDNLRHN